MQGWISELLGSGFGPERVRKSGRQQEWRWPDYFLNNHHLPSRPGAGRNDLKFLIPELQGRACQAAGTVAADGIDP
jgi:hypothetical protein